MKRQQDIMMMIDQHHLQRTVSYRCPKSHRVKQFHLVPFAGESSAVAHKSFSNEDRKLLHIIKSGKPFVISDKDHLRYSSASKNPCEWQAALVRWQLKIIIQAMTHYFRNDQPSLKMIAFGDEVERLTHLAAVLTTSGIAQCKLESINLVNNKSIFANSSMQM